MAGYPCGTTNGAGRVTQHARYVVYLSTDVADLRDGEQATSFHQENERLIRNNALSWTFLRAIDFATNALAWADQIKEGVVRWPYGQADRSLIHERDIADFVEARLTAWAGFVDTPERVTDTVEQLLGKPARTFRSWADDHADDFRA